MNNEFIHLSRRNVYIWFLLAFQAGAINAGGFVACHRFVTHTTGFATHFAYELAMWKPADALGMLTVPIFFLFGSMITSYFVDLRIKQGLRANYLIPLFLISTCLLTVLFLGYMGMAGVFGDQLVIKKDYVFLVLLCLASGLQNALITNTQGIVVRTTHLTGITTDLAVGLVRVVFLKQEANLIAREKKASIARFGIISFFILGSILSVFLYMRVDYMGFLLPIFTSLVLLIYFSLRIKKGAL